MHVDDFIVWKIVCLRMTVARREEKNFPDVVTCLLAEVRVALLARGRYLTRMSVLLN
jgi:hypothetical protein